MREAFAHDAVLEMRPDADVRAPGGAVTEALCGLLDHEPPCPLAPHHSRAERSGIQVHLRVLFATESSQEGTVRQRIESALSRQHFRGPDGTVTRWQLVWNEHSDVRPEEADHAQHLVRR